MTIALKTNGLMQAPNPLIRQYHDKLQDTVDLIDELVELGVNYEFFMNAQGVESLPITNQPPSESLPTRSNTMLV